MNYRTYFAAAAILLFGTMDVQAGKDGTPQVRSESGRNDSYVTWRLPNVATIRANRRAAEQGIPSAQFRLAVMYYRGDGVPHDYTESAYWFRKSAELGDAGAQKNLGVMYGKGQGVPQSHTEAYIWTSIAVKSGNSGAVDIRNFAGGKLSAEELDTAEHRISQLYENIKPIEIHN